MQLSSDPRYTITREPSSGNVRYVVRFCGERITCCSTVGAAMMRAVGDASRRRGGLIVTEVPAHR